MEGFHRAWRILVGRPTLDKFWDDILKAADDIGVGADLPVDYQDMTSSRGVTYV